MFGTFGYAAFLLILLVVLLFLEEHAFPVWDVASASESVASFCALKNTGDSEKPADSHRHERGQGTSVVDPRN